MNARAQNFRMRSSFGMIVGMVYLFCALVFFLRD